MADTLNPTTNLGGLAESIEKAIAGFAGLSVALDGFISGPMSAAAGAIQMVTGGLSAVVGTLGQFASAVTAPAAAMAEFVWALAPGALAGFNYAARELQATIGTALLPAFEVFTSAIHSVADAIGPVMAQLAPVFEQLAQTVASVMVPMVKILASELAAVAPLLKFMGDIVERLVPLFQAWEIIVTAAMKTIGQALGAFFGGDAVKGALDTFKHAVEELAKTMVVLSARLALLFGQTGYVNSLIQGLKDQMRPQQGGAAAPAPTNVGMLSLEGIGQKAAELAFQAGGAEGDKAPQSDNQLLQGLLDAVKGIKQDDLPTVLQNFWKDHMVPDLKALFNISGTGTVGGDLFKSWGLGVSTDTLRKLFGQV